MLGAGVASVVSAAFAETVDAAVKQARHKMLVSAEAAGIQGRYKPALSASGVVK